MGLGSAKANAMLIFFFIYCSSSFLLLNMDQTHTWNPNNHLLQVQVSSTWYFSTRNSGCPLVPMFLSQ